MANFHNKLVLNKFMLSLLALTVSARKSWARKMVS